MEEHLNQLDAFDQKLRPHMLKVAEYYQSLAINSKSDPKITCTQFGFLMGGEYYTAALRDAKDGMLFSASGSARTFMEIVADMYHIHHDPKKQDARAKKYVDSLDSFREEILKAADAVEKGTMVRIKQINPWTSTTIEDRMRAFGDAALGMYDYLSYPAHGNPAMVTFYRIEPLKEGLRITVTAAALQMMLSVLHIALKEGGAQGTTLEAVLELQKDFQAINTSYNVEPPSHDVE